MDCEIVGSYQNIDTRIPAWRILLWYGCRHGAGQLHRRTKLHRVPAYHRGPEPDRLSNLTLADGCQNIVAFSDLAKPLMYTVLHACAENEIMIVP